MDFDEDNYSTDSSDREQGMEKVLNNLKII